ncbi:MAG: hypothetical protein BMS9Abin26_1180 [Gammaproteobacteria bacterium]|nr:MAG: hypothetical protein BMS9Abin26_1180 [Gammaproteobacteria bacterium]
MNIKRYRHYLNILGMLLLMVTSSLHAEMLDDQIAGRLMQASGLNTQLEGMQLQMLQGIKQQEGKIPGHVLAALKQTISEEYAPERMKQAVYQRLRKNLEAQNAAQVLQWLDTPLGQRITAMEEDVSTPEGAQAMMAYMQKNPTPDAGRKPLLEQFIAASHATRMAVDTAIMMGFGVARGLNASMPEAERVDDDALFA